MGDELSAVREGGAGFTPGPLVVGYYAPSPAFLRIREHVAVMRPDGSLVALFGPIGDADTTHADATLFAAAGDVLHALESLYALVCGEVPSLLEDDHHDGMVRAAIEKARGQTSAPLTPRAEVEPRGTP